MGTDEKMANSLGARIETLRKRKRFSVRNLSETSGVSATYITQIESGLDPRTSKPIQPSPGKLRALADALGEGNQREAEVLYAGFLTAAGYLDSGTAQIASSLTGREQPEVAPPTAPVPASRPAPAEIIQEGPGSWLSAALAGRQEAVGVTLRDPRLLAHCYPLLNRWEEIAADWQVAFLAFVEFLDEKTRNGS